MVLVTPKPSFLEASCWSVDVVKGGVGDFLAGFFSALLNGLPSFISASIKFLLYSLILNKGKSKIYFNRILGFSNALKISES